MLMLCQYVNDEKIVMRKLKKVSLEKIKWGNGGTCNTSIVQELYEE